MGQVYLGRSPDGRLVAVKAIRYEISDHPEWPARFRREATMEAVRSPYTATGLPPYGGGGPWAMSYRTRTPTTGRWPATPKPCWSTYPYPRR
ncbi:hypothetical protein [Streptomyces phaeochromogenes]